MRRFVLLALIASFGNTSVALAGESLRAVAERVAKKQPSSASVKTAPVTPALKNLSLAQDSTAVSTSGMGKGKKFLIFLAAGVGFVATAYMIDNRVEDNTPSSNGLRED